MTFESEKLPFTRKNYVGISAGIFILVLGFIVLTQVDANAQNWAGFLSPLLIITAYVIIGVSIIL